MGIQTDRIDNFKPTLEKQGLNVREVIDRFIDTNETER